MIIGNGDVAGAIVDRPDRLYFASGVSFSGETRYDEFEREARLLIEQPRTAHIVYFGTLSELDTRYTRHKQRMESYIRALFPVYAIIRIGNILWGDNPTTLINHLRNRHAAGLPLDVQDVYRYVIDLPTFRAILANIPDGQPFEFNAYGRRLKVAQIVQEYVYGEQVAA